MTPRPSGTALDVLIGTRQPFLMFDWLSSSADAIATAPKLDGTQLDPLWALPFVGLLLSVAFLPLATPHFWERRFGTVAVFWALAFLSPCATAFGLPTAIASVLEVLLLDYLPFILLLFALFVVAGGIRLTGNLVGTPATNTAILAFGTLSASFLGTTGASMVLIRPVIRANQDRRLQRACLRVLHLPRLEYRRRADAAGRSAAVPRLSASGVDFFWTTTHLAAATLFAP